MQFGQVFHRHYVTVIHVVPVMFLTSLICDMMVKMIVLIIDPSTTAMPGFCQAKYFSAIGLSH